MNVESIRQSLVSVVADRIAVGVFEDQPEPPLGLVGTPLGDLIVQLLAKKEISSELGSGTTFFDVKGVATDAVFVFGLGPREDFSARVAFQAGVAIAKRLSAKKRECVAVAVPDAGDLAIIACALTEGLVVGQRGPDLRKKEPSRYVFESLKILLPNDQGTGTDLSEAIARGVVIGNAMNLARDLANIPPSEKPPRKLAERAREEAVSTGLSAEVWDRAKIQSERFGGLLGVSAGSAEDPAFVVLEHLHGGDAPTIALVGKGVTFDSGGLSLKPSASMEDMKSDMTGAAVVLATMSAIARLKLPVNVRGYMVMTENMTGGGAMKLGDVLTMRNGTTVEVLNTDAEGRLILADALSYAVESKPARILDLATLTGACMVALGTKIAGLFTNDDDFANYVASAAQLAGERVWRLPLDSDFKKGLKSSVADFKNVAGKWGGAITAAKFLEHFVGETPWVHLDIAGPSWEDSDSSTHDEGGTGCFVRTLIALISSGTDQKSS